MTLEIVIIWTLIAATGFALALAVQLRFLAGVALARALMHHAPDTLPSDARKQVAQAVDPAPSEDAHVVWLRETYPKPIGHMRLARRAVPMLLVVLTFSLIGGRILKVF